MSADQSSSFFDPLFGEVLQSNLNQLHENLKISAVISHLLNLDSYLAALFQQESRIFAFGSEQIDTSPKALALQILIDLITDKGFLLTFNQINPLEAMDLDRLREAIESYTKIESSIAPKLAILCWSEASEAGLGAASQEDVTTRAQQMAANFLNAIRSNCKFEYPESYLEILRYNIDYAVAMKAP